MEICCQTWNVAAFSLNFCLMKASVKPLKVDLHSFLVTSLKKKKNTAPKQQNVDERISNKQIFTQGALPVHGFWLLELFKLFLSITAI